MGSDELAAAVLVSLLKQGHRADTLECLTHGDGRGTVPPNTLVNALTPIAAQLATARLTERAATEREAQAKLDGVRAGIEASALLLERDDGFGEWWDAAQFVRSELDAEAIAKGIITADALSDLIAGDADLIDGGK